MAMFVPPPSRVAKVAVGGKEGGPVRPWQNLTPQGRTRRLRALVLAALAEYPLQVRRIRPVSGHLNMIFRVDAADGHTFAVRVARPGWRTEADLHAEARWLEALALETDMGAPVVLRTRSGEPFLTAAAGGVPQARRCLVTSWIPGRQLARDLSPTNLRRFGELSARLHRHAASWHVPPDLHPVRADRLYARGEPAVLRGEVFDAAAERVTAELATLRVGPAPPRLIHCDLNQDNVHIDGDGLRPLDFEDVVLGYPVQDIAMTFQDLLFYTELHAEGYARARAAFADGYTRWAPWPEQHPAQIDTFIAGRLLWRANYAARLQPGTGFQDWAGERLRGFLSTGTVRA